MKRTWISFIVTVSILFLIGCMPGTEEENIIPLEDEGTEQETSIVPSSQLSKENYKMILPFRPSKARGVIVNQIANRVDIDEVEKGLRRHSAEVFDPDEYYFEEGQYITESMVYEWLGRDSTGLNPAIKDEEDKKEHEENPRYLSHVLEQNFLQKKEDNTVEVAGVSIALSLKSVYRFQTETGGPYYYEKIPKDTMVKQGKEMAQKVLERIRKIETFQNVPVMIALYREEEQSSPVPGNFVAKTVIPESDKMIGEWKNINEEYVLFPSSRAKEKHFEDYELVNSFANDISKYFPNYVGVVGEGFYVNEELNKLSITVPLEFYGSGEIIGFTQYAYGIVKELFGNYYDLEIKVESSNQIESLIFQKAGEEDPTVHIFD